MNRTALVPRRPVRRVKRARTSAAAWSSVSSRGPSAPSTPEANRTPRTRPDRPRLTPTRWPVPVCNSQPFHCWSRRSTFMPTVPCLLNRSLFQHFCCQRQSRSAYRLTLVDLHRCFPAWFCPTHLLHLGHGWVTVRSGLAESGLGFVVRNRCAGQVNAGIHKLTAGSGYLYLVRQVAAHDRTHGPESLGDYYSSKGETPGRWGGRGLAGLSAGSENWTRTDAGDRLWSVAEGSEVTEDQMKALFGLGVHPNASALTKQLIAQGARKNSALTATSLGRPFRVNAGKPSCSSAWRWLTGTITCPSVRTGTPRLMSRCERRCVPTSRPRCSKNSTAAPLG